MEASFGWAGTGQAGQAAVMEIHLWDAQNRQVLCGNRHARGSTTPRVAAVTCRSCLRIIARMTGKG